MLSDGYHSLTDTASNIVGIIGVRIAGAPPDDDHPYGHRKFETMASVGIMIFLILVLWEVLSGAWERFRTGGEPSINSLTFVVMGGTFAVNLFVVFYERAAGRRLHSEVLLADAQHTLSDLMTSATVIAALIGVKAGYLWLDPVAAIVVAAFIGYACWEIFKSTTGILADRFVIPEDQILEVVKTVPEVIGSHHVRTRGSAGGTVDVVRRSVTFGTGPVTWMSKLASLRVATTVVAGRSAARPTTVGNAMSPVRSPGIDPASTANAAATS